jgi:putative chitinase
MTTLIQLAQVCTKAPLQRLAPLVSPYNDALPLAEVRTPLREAMWLAQLAHESGEFHWFEELWGPTPAQRAYEGCERLGNTQPGDGFRFRGRGVIQLTGRANYAKAGAALGLNLVAEPEMASHHLVAFQIAAWFWKAHGCNAAADAGDVVACTRIVNGGTNGLASREAYYSRARAVLAPPAVM